MGVNVSMVDDKNVVSLADLIEQRLRKQQELEYYRETLTTLQRKIGILSKEVDITTLIIDMIEGDKVLTIEEKQGRILYLNQQRDEE